MYSFREASVVGAMREQAHTHDMQNEELAGLQ